VRLVDQQVIRLTVSRLNMLGILAYCALACRAYLDGNAFIASGLRTSASIVIGGLLLDYRKSLLANAIMAGFVICKGFYFDKSVASIGTNMQLELANFAWIAVPLIGFELLIAELLRAQSRLQDMEQSSTQAASQMLAVTCDADALLDSKRRIKGSTTRLQDLLCDNDPVARPPSSALNPRQVQRSEKTRELQHLTRIRKCETEEGELKLQLKTTAVSEDSLSDASLKSSTTAQTRAALRVCQEARTHTFSAPVVCRSSSKPWPAPSSSLVHHDRGHTAQSWQDDDLQTSGSFIRFQNALQPQKHYNSPRISTSLGSNRMRSQRRGNLGGPLSGLM